MTASNSGIRSGGAHLGVDGRFEGLEVVGEHARELDRLRVVSRGVRPGAAGVQHRGRNIGTTLWNVEVEDRVLLVTGRVERARQGGANHRAGVRDSHAVSDAIRTAGP